MRPKVLTRTVSALADTLHVVAGVLLIVIAGITVADVVSRNVRDASILGAADISTLLLVAVAFLGLASAELHGRHVAVEVVEARLSSAGRRGAALLRLVVIVLIGVILVWGLFDVLVSALDRAETTNGILRLATWPAKAVLLGSFALFFVAAISQSWTELMTLRRGEGTPDHPRVAGVSTGEKGAGL